MASLDRILEMIDRRIAWLIVAVMTFRLAFILTSDLDLIGDEAYYWEWSRRPDWCYYSKPPMVAWLIAAFTGLFGHETWVVRLPVVLLGGLSLWFLQATARAFHGAKAAVLCVLLLLATPNNVLANFLMTIDPPLYAFWIMTVYFLRRALFDDDKAAWWWAGLTAAAALLSKQAALLLPLLLAIYLALDSQRRRFFKREFGWFMLPVLLVIVQIVVWNAANDWVMFGHSKGHFTPHEALTIGQRIKHSLEFLMYQALLLSPLIWLMSVMVSVQGGYRFKTLTDQQRFLWLFGPAPMLAVLLLSVVQKVQGNWPMPFYLSALILVAGEGLNGRWPRMMKPALAIGGVLVVVTYGLPMALKIANLQGTALDPTKRFNNWRVVAAGIDAERRKTGLDLADTFVVATGHRYLASELAFYLPDHPQVFRYETSGTVQSQYELWPSPDVEFSGRDGFVISEEAPDTLPHLLTSAFQSLRWLARIDNPDKPQRPYHLYWGKQLTHWPQFRKPPKMELIDAAP